jgi:hypothetical protein
MHIGEEGPKHREELNITEPVSQVSIDLGAGNLEVVASDAAPVSVAAVIQGGKNRLRQELRSGTLALSVDCVESPCSADVQVRVPAAAPLSAKTGSADIEVVGARASAELETGSGNITARELGAAEVDARSGSGDVELVALVPPRRVHVRTGSGNVTLRVPEGGAYRLDIARGSGEERVRGIARDASAERAIAVETGSGDVDIDAS